MKKAVFLATLAVMTASVFGMNNPLPANSNQASGSGRQQFKNVKDFVNADEDDRRKIVKKLLKISNITIGEDVLGEAQTLNNPWDNESLTNFIKSLSPKSIQKLFSGIKTNFDNQVEKNKIIDDWFEKDKNKLLKIYGENAKDIPDLIKNLTEAQLVDILNTSHILSEIVKNFANVDEVSQLLLFNKNKRRVSNVNIEKSRTSVFGYVSCFLETLCQKHPFYYACEKGHEDIVKYLVTHGADVNKEKEDGETPLFDACWEGHENIVKYLVEHGADINKEREDGETPLFDACWEGHENIVKYLVEHGADVNKESKDGETPLFDACRKGNKNIVKYLVEQHGADVNKEDRDGKAPLHIACKKGHKNIVKYLIKHGADVNKEDKDGRTPLFDACHSENKSLVKYLVKHGADVNKENNFGETPLFNECRAGNESLVKYLVEHGADVNKENNFGETPLFNECRAGNESLVKYLVEHGAEYSESFASDSSDSESSTGEIPTDKKRRNSEYSESFASDSSDFEIPTPESAVLRMESNDAHNNTEDWKVFRRQRMFELYGPQQISDSSDSYRLFSDKDISKDLSSSKMIEESGQNSQIYGENSTDKKRRNSEYSESFASDSSDFEIPTPESAVLRMESNDAHNNTEDWKVFRRQRMFELYGPQQISDSSDESNNSSY